MTNQNVFSIVDLEDHYISNPLHLSINRPGLYPSEASVVYMEDGFRIVQGKCLRAAWYRNTGVPESSGPKPGLMMKANLGKWDEIGVVNRWKEMGIWLGNNIKFYQSKFVLSGELDAVIKDPATDKKIGVEVKTFYNFAANKEICGAKRDQIPGIPKDSHFMQALVYWWEYQNILDEYRLYYLERGDGHRVEFRVGFDTAADGTHPVWWEQIPGNYWNFYKEGKVVQPFTIEDIHARYTELIAHIRNKTLPAKDFERAWSDERIEWAYSKGYVGKTKYEDWKKNPGKNPIASWHCSYCGHSDQCAQDEMTAAI
jgi:hypothetical protein